LHRAVGGRAHSDPVAVGDGVHFFNGRYEASFIPIGQARDWRFAFGPPGLKSEFASKPRVVVAKASG
jgi:hypothetical protein